MKHLILLLLLPITLAVTAQAPRLMLPLTHTNDITGIAIHNSGRFFATSSEDKTVKLWDANTGKLLQNFTGLPEKVRSVAFHPKKSTVIAACDTVVYEWNIYTGKQVDRIVTRFIIDACTFSNDGSKLAITNNVSYSNSNILVYDYTNKKLLGTIAAAHTDRIDKLIFDSTGKYLVSGGWDNAVRIWDVTTFKQKAKVEYPKTYSLEIRSLSVHPDGKTVLVCNKSQGLLFYNFNDLSLRKRIQRDSIIFSDVAYSNDGKYFVTTSYSRKLHVWNTAEERIERTVYASLTADVARFDVTGTKLLCVRNLDRIMMQFHIASGRELFSIKKNSAKLNAARFNRSGFLITTASDDGLVKVWSTTQGRFLINMRGHTDDVQTASFGSELTSLVSAGYDKTARIWNWSKGELLKTIKLPGAGFYNTELSKDGKQMLTGVWLDSAAYVWDVETGKQLYKLKHEDRVYYAIYNFDGSMIGTCSRDGIIKIWNSTTGALIKELQDKNPSSVNSISFDPRLKTLLLSTHSDRTVRLWNIDSGKCLGSMKAQTDEVNYAAFSPKKNAVIIASNDNTAKIIDISQGKLVATLAGHTDDVIFAEFSQENNLILTLSKDNTVKLWDANTYKLLITYIAIGSKDYLTLTDNHYYMSSPGAARKLHYVTADLTTISFDQFDLFFNRPDKIAEVLGNKFLVPPYRKAWEKRMKKAGIKAYMFKEGYSVPRSRIANINDIAFEQSNAKLPLRVVASDSLVINRLNIWVNEVPLMGMKGIRLRETNTLDSTLEVPLSDGMNIIEISVVNNEGIESMRHSVTVLYTPKKLAEEKVHFIGIALNKYREEGHDLSWSVKDVQDLATKFKEKYGNRLTIDTLFDDSVTPAAVYALKAKLKQLGINDKVIFAFSGHGLLSNNFDYYLATYNIDFNNPEKNGDGILYDDLENMFDSIAPRKKLMMIDACHSGEIDKDELEVAEKQKKDLEKNGVKGVVIKVRPTKKAGENSFELLEQFFANVSRGTGTNIISAAAGTRYAIERGDLKNGVFTYSVIEAMNKYPSISVQSLKQIVTSRVLQLTNSLQRPNSREETNLVDWRLW